MILIRCYVDKSKIHGIGLFASEDIPRGTVIWRMDNEFDRVFTREQFLDFPKPVQEFMVKYSWLDGEVYILHSDLGKFINHSETPNIICEKDNYTIASRDIKAGDELTENYFDYDDLSIYTGSVEYSSFPL